MRYCFPTATMLAWTSLNVTLHLHCLCWYSSSAPTPTFTDTIKTWTQELVKKIVKNTVEVLHSVAHDISLAAEWGWREDDFSCVLNASAEAIEQGNYPTTEGGCSSNSSANKRNRERCGSAVITEQLKGWSGIYCNSKQYTGWDSLTARRCWLMTRSIRLSSAASLKRFYF